MDRSEDKHTPPTDGEWEALYRAATQFKKIECWKWMLDSDVFGVKDPSSGKIGLCSVLGNAEEVFGLTLYPEREGFECYLRMASGGYAVDEGDTPNCLLASFEDRKNLSRMELAVIKRLGMKFRGRNAWPVFQSYIPGYYPWYLIDKEAVFLAAAMDQAKEVSLRFRENRDLFVPPAENLYLVRVPVAAGERGAVQWADEWFPPPPAGEGGEPKERRTDFGEARIEKIRRDAPLPGGALEVDFFPLPTQMGEKGKRPLVPYLILLVAFGNGIILGQKMATFRERRSAFIECLFRFIETYGILPRQLLFEREEAADIFREVAQRLGIEVIMVGKLEKMKEARAGMIRSFGQ